MKVIYINGIVDTYTLKVEKNLSYLLTYHQPLLFIILCWQNLTFHSLKKGSCRHNFLEGLNVHSYTYKFKLVMPTFDVNQSKTRIIRLFIVYFVQNFTKGCVMYGLHSYRDAVCRY